MTTRLTTRTPTRPSGQAGFAMPVVIAVSALLLILAAVASSQAISTTKAANRDRHVKTAGQAADAGLELALFRLNAVIAGQALPCATKDAGGSLVLGGYDAGGQWCPPVADTHADGTTTTYVVSKEAPIAGSSPPLVDRKVVATGEYMGQKRRVYTQIQAREGVAGFGVYGISAKDKVLFQDSARAGTPSAAVDVRTNGDIVMKGTSSICGNVTPGPGKTLTQESGAVVCAGKSTAPATTQLTFPDYDVEHTAARTVNQNLRLGCSGLPLTDACTNASDVLWDASRRELIVQGDASVTLGGDVYSFCRLNLKGNSRLYIAPRPSGAPPLKLYFDSPSNCPGVPTEQIMIENGWGITNHNTAPVTLQLFVRGSTSTETLINFKNNVANSQSTPLMLYAPNSTVILENAARFTGGLVGKTVELKNGVQFDYDPAASTPVGATALIYQPMQYRECSPVPPAAAQDSGC
jgi:hypothetical protein